MDLTCTVFYNVIDNSEAPFFLNVSLEGQDHCYTYLEQPTFGPGPTAGPTGTIAPGTTAGPTGTLAPEPTTTFVEQPVYCCGSWGSYLTEDDRNAGKATSVLSVIACTNYTDGVEIALR